MIVSGWGRYPRVDCCVSLPQTRQGISSLLVKGQSIARGGGRAYGDSAINMANTIEMRCFDQLVAFDPTTGLLSAGAGVQLRDIMETFVPRGWILPVTPGTSFVTLGGAIASDVHGKNHHLVGTFGPHVREIEMMLGNGEVITVSPVHLPDLFHATCGGMGLTGIILSAKVQLAPIKSSLIRQQAIKAESLDELFELFEANSETSYSVAWIDCLATKRELGRSVLLLGEHVECGEKKFDTGTLFSLPINSPAFLINRWSIQAFNEMYYAKAKRGGTSIVGLYAYFYPLDKIANWNRLYGGNGFVQYHFVIPKPHGAKNMRKVLTRIAEDSEGAFLAVMKRFGAENTNLLSFPFSGYTLALDFKISRKTIDFLKMLDNVVADMGGRIYLTKDALMSEETFKRTYPNWERFQAVREKYGALRSFSSAQSMRLGLQ